MGKQSGSRNSVLIASYLFPPLGGIGAQRPLKFVKYLNKLDWKVNVITVKNAYSATEDPTLLNEIPEHVHVVHVSDPISKLIGKTVSNSVSNQMLKGNFQTVIALKKGTS